ncbi:NAD(P)H-dependent glycerol-3-phosphate dehydrogenase [Serinibacter salmoneus]|uniref:Glycerol-3-phosphate dehydrogenase [NAD(P)+] n=1 Tax=Serinibacter salmoneus TaxID=556530 RepID=A0A2A9D2S5_9MICO|nr:NAD(P)H-dependent glycerol-3-phosphate dehydrogenase [Serinibacter salmoneus]PFG20149.1 glycerol-3-phosphate dehydrogenase (NAD(P)+) [Serinibacter salmoneus]
MRCTVIGAGNWGTTFAQILADAGNPVVLWTHVESRAEEITDRHTNLRYLPEAVLSDRITATTDMAAALQGAELVVVALPSDVVRRVLADHASSVPRSAIVVSLMKGVEHGTDTFMSQVLSEIWDIPAQRMAVLSGPNLAGEIIRRQPTTSVVACTDEQVALRVAGACATPYFRVFTTTDVIGAEVGGAVKNVIALAVGIAQGVGYGDNTMASIMTRGLSEASRIGVSLGAQAETFAGLAGMGDLIATCSSPLSRNHRLGSLVGKGYSLQQAVAEIGTTAEGAKSCRAILDLAQQRGIRVSITAAVVAVLYDGLPVPEMVSRLVERPPRAED